MNRILYLITPSKPTYSVKIHDIQNTC